MHKCTNVYCSTSRSIVQVAGSYMGNDKDAMLMRAVDMILEAMLPDKYASQSSQIYIYSYIYLTKTHNWVEWTAPSVSLSQTKVNDINLNDRPQMQNDTENEIGRSLFPFIHGLRILISFDYLHQSHAVKISLGCFWVDT